MKTATIVETRGAQFPGEVERIYRLRAGSKGTGRILGEHRARGDYRATDAAIQDLTETAKRLGYTLAE
jgi:hypothetical protein